jgi:hypothetical protein
MKRAMLSAVLCLLLSGCSPADFYPPRMTPDGQRDYSALDYEQDYIKAQWVRDYEGCQIGIVKSRGDFDVAWADSPAKREVYCSCVTNVLEDTQIKYLHHPDRRYVSEIMYNGIEGCLQKVTSRRADGSF